MSNGEEKPGGLLPHEKAEVELIKDFIGLRKNKSLKFASIGAK